MISLVGATRRRSIALAATAAAAALALSACASSSGGGDAAGGTTPASSSSTPSSGASLASLVPSGVSKTVTFAMDATYPPDEMLGSDGKTVTGLDADLATALSSVLGLTPTLQNVTFDNIIPGLQDGKYDIGLSSFTDTKDREKVVDFVTYFQAGEGFYTKAGSSTTFDGLASLCGAKVAVEKGTVEQTDAQTQNGKCASGKKITLLVFGDQNAANLAVSSGRADVGFADSQIAEYIVKQSNGQFQNSGKAFEVAPYGIAFPKNSKLTAPFLAAMKAIIANGTYKTLLAKWGVQDGAITTPVLNGATS